VKLTIKNPGGAKTIGGCIFNQVIKKASAT
jgi:hypothetical protein